MVGKICRLCFETKSRPLAIFTARGIKLKIADIIRLHFSNEVSECCMRLLMRFEEGFICSLLDSSAGRRRRCSAKIRLCRLLDENGKFPRILQCCERPPQYVSDERCQQ